MAFPGPYSRIYRNEAGEVLGWDNEYPEDAPYEPTEEEDRRWYIESLAAEEAFEYAAEEGASDEDAEEFSAYRIKRPDVDTDLAWRDWLRKK
jgi:hypothetical protein